MKWKQIRKSIIGWPQSYFSLELHYVYGPPNSKTSLEHVQKRHLYTKEVDAYLVGKMAQCIWHNKWDKDLFTKGVGTSIFLLKINALIHEDPKKRPSLASDLEIFIFHPHNFELLLPL
jgi:hypothetical protein